MLYELRDNPKYNRAKIKEHRPIIAAAIKFKDGFVAVGARHFDPAMHNQIDFVYGTKEQRDENYPVEHEQGFINCWGEFLTREEAAEIAYELGQIPEPTCRLYSEDLY